MNDTIQEGMGGGGTSRVIGCPSCGRRRPKHPLEEAEVKLQLHCQVLMVSPLKQQQQKTHRNRLFIGEGKKVSDYSLIG